jgi:carotenoid cleavage dioxygenase
MDGGGLNAINPYLNGGYGPVSREVDATDLPVIGDIPMDLSGLYVRNGPNPERAPEGMHHWFDGDGMFHGLWLENGKARYANRYLQGGDLKLERAGKLDAAGIFKPANRARGGNRVYKDTGNTDVVFHNGQLLGLWYISGTPVAVNPTTLETIRDETFSGALPRNISAHSKVDPRTGELVFFDYALYEPWMSYGTISADGHLTHFTQVELPGPRLPHDMGLTENYVILHDLPVVFTDKALRTGMWNIHTENRPTRFGVAPRKGRGDEVKWFEAPPAYVYHVVNCWEDGDSVYMAACKMVPNGHRPNPARFGDYAGMVNVLALHANLYLWRFDLKTGQAHETQLDDQIAEFPIVNLDRTGAHTRHSYHVTMAPNELQKFDGILKYDLGDGSSVRHAFQPGVYGSEPAFAPRIGAKSEDDGYVITFVTDEASGKSEALILDAQNFAAPPLARIQLPQRVPFGFHATWVRGDQLKASAA